MKQALVTILAILSFVGTYAEAVSVRHIDWTGDPVKINVPVGRGSRVTMPGPIADNGVIKVQAGVDAQVQGSDLLLQIVDPSLKEADVFVVTQSNAMYQLVLVNGKDIDYAVIRDPRAASAKQVLADVEATKDLDPPSLVVSMARGEELPGFSVSEKDLPLQRFSRNGMIEATLKKVYQSPTFTGYVVELRNISILPYTVREPDFIGSSIVACGFSRPSGYIAPAPNTGEQVRAAQHRLLVYLVSYPGGVR